MAKINSNYQKLNSEYIFPVIERKLAELKKKKPDVQVLNLGIGDIALPLAPKIIDAICSAVQEMGSKESMRGYGPAEGYLFLREAIVKHEYKKLGINADEIFISDGTSTDTANIQELFGTNNIVGITDPTYPVYLASNIMAGRGNKILFLPCTQDSGFVPTPPKEHCDLVYLCSPNNPTGMAMTKDQLTAWVKYAKKEQAILFYDNAYLAFITSPNVPKSIFEIEGAKDVAIEFRSFSKSAGFTGLRCAYTTLPKTVRATFGKRKLSLHSMWERRQSTRYNGVAYPIQRGAEAVFSKEGKEQTQSQVNSYQRQAKLLLQGLQKLGHSCFGGIDSPYIWWKTPFSLSSWEFFDLLLKKCYIISIPGKGFGEHGEGYVRLSAFTSEEKVIEALTKIKDL
jgi:LL-diaminopimelate aminotransferase